MLLWTHIESSVISAAAYEKDSLYLRFTSGEQYEYLHVQKNIYEELMHAKSKGQYFNLHNKNQFDFRKT